MQSSGSVNVFASCTGMLGQFSGDLDDRLETHVVFSREGWREGGSPVARQVVHAGVS